MHFQSCLCLIIKKVKHCYFSASRVMRGLFSFSLWNIQLRLGCGSSSVLDSGFCSILGEEPGGLGL